MVNIIKQIAYMLPIISGLFFFLGFEKIAGWILLMCFYFIMAVLYHRSVTWFFKKEGDK